MQLHDLLATTVQRRASDLHVAAGLQPRIRLHGFLDIVEGSDVLDDVSLRTMLRSLITEAQWSNFEDRGEFDFAYTLEGVGRFRANFFEQERGAAAAFRLIPESIQPLHELGLPKAVAGLADFEEGLILVTGPTGSGKSTTLASLVDLINQRHSRHVVTIEDPVEFVHTDRKCVFSQREVGTDSSSFADALRAAMRQDADVILVGELRDLETISLALTAAEMGALVLGTLHTNSAAKTIDRIVDVFPAEEQSQTRIALADSLAGVVAQILLPTIDGAGRCAATEILLGGRGLSNIIREGATPMIQNVIQGGRARGMRSMDDSLVELCKAGLISFDEGYRRAAEKEPFERLAGEQSSGYV